MSTKFNLAVDESKVSLERNNLICCLQFLVGEAVSASLEREAFLLNKAIADISAVGNVAQDDSGKEFLDLLVAFKVFVQFFVMGDGRTREEFLKHIEMIEPEILTGFSLRGQ